MKNQITELLNKFPHMRKNSEYLIIEIFLEEEINGKKSAYEMFSNLFSVIKKDYAEKEK